MFEKEIESNGSNMLNEYEPRSSQLSETHARRRHAVNPGVIEQAELVLREPIEVVAAEPGAIQVQLLKAFQ